MHTAKEIASYLSSYLPHSFPSGECETRQAIGHHNSPGPLPNVGGSVQGGSLDRCAAHIGPTSPGRAPEGDRLMWAGLSAQVVQTPHIIHLHYFMLQDDSGNEVCRVTVV